MTNTPSFASPKRHSQGGAALVISLILLTVITILSVSAMRSTNLDTKIAVNQQLKELSYWAAENALSLVTAEEVTVELPNALGAGNAVMNNNYFQSTGVDGQPDISANVNIEMMEITRRYKFHGFPLNVLAVMYQADSQGVVAGNNTQTVNRMQVALIRN
jgi:type IV pilus assembly protein PilX